MADENRVVLPLQDDEPHVCILYFPGQPESVPFIWGQAPDSELIEFRCLWRYPNGVTSATKRRSRGNRDGRVRSRSGRLPAGIGFLEVHGSLRASSESY